MSHPNPRSPTSRRKKFIDPEPSSGSVCCYLHPQTGNHAEGCQHFRYGEETPSPGEKRRREKFNREKHRGQLDLGDESHKQRELFGKAKTSGGITRCG